MSFVDDCIQLLRLQTIQLHHIPYVQIKYPVVLCPDTKSVSRTHFEPLVRLDLIYFFFAVESNRNSSSLVFNWMSLLLTQVQFFVYLLKIIKYCAHFCE